MRQNGRAHFQSAVGVADHGERSMAESAMT
jgi:hypothetical protein